MLGLNVLADMVGDNTLRGVSFNTATVTDGRIESDGEKDDVLKCAPAESRELRQTCNAMTDCR